MDFLQYAANTIIWGLYHRVKETSGSGEEDEFLAPAWINYPANALFYLKLVATIIAYGLVVAAMADSFWK